VNEWYSPFLIGVLVLWGFSTAKDRNMLRVLAAASVAAEVMKYGMTVHIHGAWKLLFPATLELMTLWAMLRWATGRTALIQAVFLCIAWACHVICFLDIMFGSDIVYSNYETALLTVAVGQLLACYDTMRSVAIRVYNALRITGHPDLRGVPAPVLRNSVLRREGERQI